MPPHEPSHDPQPLRALRGGPRRWSDPRSSTGRRRTRVEWWIAGSVVLLAAAVGLAGGLQYISHASAGDGTASGARSRSGVVALVPTRGEDSVVADGRRAAARAARDAATSAGAQANAGHRDERPDGAAQEHSGSEADELHRGRGRTPGLIDASAGGYRPGGAGPRGGAQPEDGLHREWHAPGVLAAEGPYEDGARDGEWVSYYPDGSLQQVGEYEDGKRAGQWRAYHPGGQPMFEGTYSEGRPEGTWVRWYQNGQVREQGVFEGGLREGYWEFYDRFGVAEARTGIYRYGAPFVN